MLVGRDPHLSSSICARRALVAKLALATCVAWKADGRAQENRRLLARRARDGHGPKVEFEVGLRVEVAVVRHPGLADDKTSAVEDLGHDRAGDVATVDV